MGIQQGLCGYGGFLYAAWKGESGDDRLYCGQYDTNKKTWDIVGPPACLIPGNSSVGPSLATDGTRLFAAWKGMNGDDRLFFSLMGAPGCVWSWDFEISGAASAVGPGLAVLGDTLYAVWIDSSSGGDESVLKYSAAPIRPGLAVSKTVFRGSRLQIPGAFGSVGPSLAASPDGTKLYAAWKGSFGSQSIWYSVFTPSEGWGTPTDLGVRSAYGPSIAAFGDDLWFAWGGVNDERIYVATLAGLTANSQGIAIPPAFTSSIGPAIAECNGKLYCMWKGAGGDQQIFLACFDGSEWMSLGTVPGNTGQDVSLDSVPAQRQFAVLQ
jgi:hypothetical protein